MATHAPQIFDSERIKLKNPESVKIIIVNTAWNSQIIEKLTNGAKKALIEANIPEKNLAVINVPGAFELPFAVAEAINENETLSGIIALGCIIKGETPHFDFIADAVSNGLMQVQLTTGIPVAFGVLTTLNQEQAMERAGGKLGNKGEEAAQTLLQMLSTRYKVF